VLGLVIGLALGLVICLASALVEMSRLSSLVVVLKGSPRVRV
jgi:hypothetical protein